jgi:hypothetical protein
LTVVVSQGSADFTCKFSSSFVFFLFSSRKIKTEAMNAVTTNKDPGAGVPLGILSVYEPLGGILCANLPFLYKHATSMCKKVVSSLSPVQTEGMAPSTGAGVHRPQYLLWKRKQDVSMQSEWSRLQRDTDKSTGTTMSEMRSVHAGDEDREIEDHNPPPQRLREPEP